MDCIGSCSGFNESCLSLEVVAHFINLHAQPHFNYWLIEAVSPKVLQFINRKWAHHFKAANFSRAVFRGFSFHSQTPQCGARESVRQKAASCASAGDGRQEHPRK